MDSDVQHIYVDGLCNIVKTLDSNESMIKLNRKLQVISKQYDVGFTISVNYNPEDLPEDVRALLM